MKVLVLLLGLVCATQASIGSWDDMKDKMDKYNLFVSCFGDKTVYKYSNMIKQSYDECEEYVEDSYNMVDLDGFAEDDWNSLSELVDSPVLGRFMMADRKKRDADSDDVEGFRESTEETKEQMKKNLAMLGCVFRKMGLYDENNEINLERMSAASLKPQLAKTPVGQDDEWMDKFVNMFQDCYDISESWPQTMLDRHPLMKLYGRKKVFFECMLKGEMELCYKWQMYQGMKSFYHIDTGVEDIGLVGDKFEKAKSAWLMKMEHSDKSWRFVNDFFWARRRG